MKESLASSNSTEQANPSATYVDDMPITKDVYAAVYIRCDDERTDLYSSPFSIKLF